MCLVLLHISVIMMFLKSGCFRDMAFSYHHERRVLPREIYRSVVRMGEVYEAQHIKLFEQNHQCGLALALAHVCSKNQYGKKFYISPKSGEP